ncbi:MAG TPA: Hsp20/alpha crystallin family protein [Kofleriaceae bacterium]|nr:Hsp20/alpha crystallin family protein [Kofleriaceae bacterium]
MAYVPDLWNPFSLLDELDRAWTTSRARSSSWPHFDIEDRDDEVLLVADVPGMTDDHLDITVQGQLLTVRGERPYGDGRYVYRTRPSGQFVRQFQLAPGADLDRIEAHVEHGVLVIRVPKTDAMKPRKIKLGNSLGAGLASKVKGLLGREKHEPTA